MADCTNPQRLVVKTKIDPINVVVTVSIAMVAYRIS